MELDAGASRHMLHASLADCMEQMRSARPVSIEIGKEAWLASRESNTRVVPSHQRRSGSGGQQAAAVAAMSTLPAGLPELPRGFVLRADVMARSKKVLIGTQALYHDAKKLLLQGMVKC